MFGPDDRLRLWNISSLRRWNYLPAFPFDKIKIDQTFIAKIGNNFQAEAIIHAILGLGRALALPVIAGGVETEDQRAGLPCQGGIRNSGLSDRPSAADH
jgi:EAL domain-containing protein (putative c-di-GMP-specific phosphodiesterase class I)